MYLNIKTNYEVVYGNNGAVLYDFDSNNVYDVHLTESNILKEIESESSVESLYEKYPLQKIEAFLEQLVALNIFEYSNKFIPVERYRIGTLENHRLNKKYYIDKCYIELPCICNKGCIHCNKNKINGCYSCSQPLNSEYNDTIFYKKIMKEILSYECKNLIFHGGNPFNNWNFTKQIIDDALILKRSDTNILLIINDDYISSEIINYIKLNKIKIIVNLTYKKNMDISDLNKNIDERFGFYNNNLLINFNVSNTDIDSYKNFHNKYLTKIKYNIFYSIYFENEYGKISYNTDLATFSNDISTFRYLEVNHPCLFGSISIKTDKKVYLCIGFTNNSLLDLNIHSLSELFDNSSELLEFWEMSTKK